MSGPTLVPQARARRRRVKAVLALGVLTLGFSTGTFAFWTDSAPVDGGTFTSGTLDVTVNDADSHATTTLAMAAMVPGSTAAEVVTVRNAGTAPLKWSLRGGLTGTDAAAYASAGSLRITVVAGGSRSGSGSSATCTGGTTLVTAVALTAVTDTGLVGPRGPLAPTSAESVCLQVGLAADAPSSLQGRSAALSMTVLGTSDVS